VAESHANGWDCSTKTSVAACLCRLSTKSEASVTLYKFKEPESKNSSLPSERKAIGERLTEPVSNFRIRESP